MGKSDRTDLGTCRPPPRISQSSHCGFHLWLLPPLPWHRPSSGKRPTLAHDPPSSRIKADTRPHKARRSSCPSSPVPYYRRERTQGRCKDRAGPGESKPPAGGGLLAEMLNLGRLDTNADGDVLSIAENANLGSQPHTIP